MKLLAACRSPIIDQTLGNLMALSNLTDGYAVFIRLGEDRRHLVIRDFLRRSVRGMISIQSFTWLRRESRKRLLCGGPSAPRLNAAARGGPYAC